MAAAPIPPPPPRPTAPAPGLATAFAFLLLAEFFLTSFAVEATPGSAAATFIRTLQFVALAAFAVLVIRRPVSDDASPLVSVLVGAAFFAVHAALGLLLRFDRTAFDSAVRLIDIFFLWVPILTLAAYMGLGWGKRIRMPVRLAILLVYGLALAVLGAIATPGEDPPNCNLDPEAPLCLASPWFDLLFRLAPIPAFVFLFANGRHRWTLGQCFGLALALLTLWRGAYNSFQDLLVIASGGTVLGPTPAIQFYRSFFLKALWEVFYVVVGLFFIFRRVPGVHRPLQFGNEIERIFRPLGAWTRRDIKTDLAWGATIFVPLAIGAATLSWLLTQGPTGDVGDDSRVYNEITFDLVFLLSIAAGVGEEIVFRGFLQSALERLLVFRGWPRPAYAILGGGVTAALGVGTYMVLFVDVVNGILTGIGIATFAGVIAMSLGWGGFGIAILLQALLFGIFHSGYGDLDHVIVPLMFGLIAGIVYRLFGLLAIILIHVEVDIFAFASSYQGPYSVMLNVGLFWVFLLQFAFAIVWVVLQLLQWFEGRRRVMPVIARS